MRGPVPLLALLSLLLPGGLRAHGLTTELVTSEGGVIMKCTYAGGEPAQAEVLVRSPADATRYFAIMRTDSDGQARFVPDEAGEWSVTVDDGWGHRVSLSFRVDGKGAIESVAGPVRRPGRFAALVLAGCGLVVWWRLYRRRGKS